MSAFVSLYGDNEETTTDDNDNLCSFVYNINYLWA